MELEVTDEDDELSRNIAVGQRRKNAREPEAERKIKNVIKMGHLPPSPMRLRLAAPMSLLSTSLLCRALQ